MGNWIEELTPDDYVSSVYEIDLDELWKSGKRIILTDLDNTLVPWNDPNAPKELANWLQQARDRGFQICIVSNNKGPRVQAFAAETGIPAVGNARKPKPDVFLETLKRLEAKPEEAVMVGDQLFTDVRGGNRCGLHTILVLPINPREWWGTRLVRIIERVAMKQLVRRGLEVPARK